MNQLESAISHPKIWVSWSLYPQYAQCKTAKFGKSMEPRSRVYHELFNADLSNTGLANSRRCLIVDELSKKEVNIVRYVEPAEKFMRKFHDRAFCQR